MTLTQLRDHDVSAILATCKIIPQNCKSHVIIRFVSKDPT